MVHVPYGKRLFSALARHKSDSDLQQSLLTQQPGLQPMQQFPPLVHPQIPSSQAPPLNQKREAVPPTSSLPLPFLSISLSLIPLYLLSSLAFSIVLHSFFTFIFSHIHSHVATEVHMAPNDIGLWGKQVQQHPLYSSSPCVHVCLSTLVGFKLERATEKRCTVLV